mgnify:CR=1 FL=1
MYVLTIDQRGSTADVDRVPDLITALRSLASAPFERSVGDELQGVVEHAEDVVEIAMYALRSGHWYVGIGVGAVQLTPGGSPREGSGSGFVAARKAGELAKGAAGQFPLSVGSGSCGPCRGGPPRPTETPITKANCPGGASPRRRRHPSDPSRSRPLLALPDPLHHPRAGPVAGNLYGPRPLLG